MRPVDLTDLPHEQLVEWLTMMVLIREFEAACEPLAASGLIPGGIHSASGQEAVAVGAARALKPTDIAASSHRSHHVSLAKGLTPDSVMAELFGKATGCVGGRGGHMHLSDFSIGLYGSNGIVGGGVGIAMGAALAAQMRHVDQVTLGFFGDGGANNGRVWEFVNLATIWRLPLVIVCENNLYAVETYVGSVTGGDSIADRAAGFGIQSEQIDGQDVGSVYRSVRAARDRAIAGEGPTFIEAITYRYRGHNTGDPATYRTTEEVDRWRAIKDPIVRFNSALVTAGIALPGSLDDLTNGCRDRIAAAISFAEESPWPDRATALDNVTGLHYSLSSNP
jgi:TPP-dependent pyruvate/acetoin dehydrogenase alpha subunit